MVTGKGGQGDQGEGGIACDLNSHSQAGPHCNHSSPKYMCLVRQENVLTVYLC